MIYLWHGHHRFIAGFADPCQLGKTFGEQFSDRSKVRLQATVRALLFRVAIHVNSFPDPLGVIAPKLIPAFINKLLLPPRRWHL